VAEDGRPICRTQHTAIQGIHLLRLGDNLSGLGAGLRSEQHPLERPELTGTQRARVEHDNEAARFFVLVRSTSLQTGAEDPSGRTTITAFIGGKPMRSLCGRAGAGWINVIQHVVSGEPELRCSAFNTISQVCQELT